MKGERSCNQEKASKHPEKKTCLVFEPKSEKKGMNAIVGSPSYCKEVARHFEVGESSKQPENDQSSEACSSETSTITRTIVPNSSMAANSQGTSMEGVKRIVPIVT